MMNGCGIHDAIGWDGGLSVGGEHTTGEQMISHGDGCDSHGRGLRYHVRAHGCAVLSGVDAVALSHFGSHGFACGCLEQGLVGPAENILISQVLCEEQ